MGAAPQDGYKLDAVKARKWSSMTGHLPQDRVDFLTRHLAPGSVLEVGCGGGWYAQHFGSDHEVTACDLHEDFLSVPKEIRRFLFHKADAVALPFGDKRFQTSFSLDVLEHVEDDVAALKELARVTRGEILLSIPRKADEVRDFGLAFLPYFDPTHFRYYDEPSIRELCERAGLGIPVILPASPVRLTELCAAYALTDDFPGRIPLALKPYFWLGALGEGLKALPKEGILLPSTWSRRFRRRIFGSSLDRFRPIHTEYFVRVRSA